MADDNHYEDREKDFQIERLANENEWLQEKLREKDKTIQRLEKELLLTIRQKNNNESLRRGSQKNRTGEKANSKGGNGQCPGRKNGKIYTKCQKCGVGLVSPKPGQKFCIRHQRLNFKSGDDSGGYGRYKHVKVYQGGSPGGGKKR